MQAAVYVAGEGYSERKWKPLIINISYANSIVKRGIGIFTDKFGVRMVNSHRGTGARSVKTGAVHVAESTWYRDTEDFLATGGITSRSF